MFIPKPRKNIVVKLQSEVSYVLSPDASSYGFMYRNMDAMLNVWTYVAINQLEKQMLKSEFST